MFPVYLLLYYFDDINFRVKLSSGPLPVQPQVSG